MELPTRWWSLWLFNYVLAQAQSHGSALGGPLADSSSSLTTFTPQLNDSVQHMAGVLRPLASSRSFAVPAAVRAAKTAAQAPLQWRRTFQTSPGGSTIPDYAFAFECDQTVPTIWNTANTDSLSASTASSSAPPPLCPAQPKPSNT